MPKLFISYAREDVATAHRLAELLEAQGLSVWWDPQLRAGEDFSAKIEQVLQQVGAVIVLWSAHSVGSRWVRAEASEGLRLGKLVPVALDDAKPPLVFRALHTARLERAELDAETQSVRKLCDDIRATLGNPSAGPPHTGVAGARPRPRWRYPATLALLVSSLLLVLALFDAPARLLDALTGAVAGSRLRADALMTELTLAGLSLALLLWSGRQLKQKHGRAPGWMLTALAAALISGATVYTWGERAINPPPDHLAGRVLYSDWNDMVVTALNASGETVSLGRIPVSTENGAFGMRIIRSFANRPSRLVVGKTGCADRHTPLEWSRWRTREEIVIPFRCDPET